MGRHFLRRKALIGLGLAAALAVGTETLPASALTIPDHPAVAAQTKRFLDSRWEPWFRLVAGRASLYAHYIATELQRRQLPVELIFLPAIESEYLDTAVSNRGAAGLWQLMATTATALGLVIDEMRDERRDFWMATDAALTILAQNRRILGSWDLALAAYNAGPTRIREAVATAGTDDFWRLRELGLLPTQTAEFVPRFYGLVAAAAALDPPLNMDLVHDWGWQRLEAPPGVDLRVLARLAEVPVEVLLPANRELRFWLTPEPVAGRPYQIKVPSRYESALAAVLASRLGELVRLHLHKIRSGDTLSALAVAFEVPVSMVRTYNPGLVPRFLAIGSAVLIPVVGDVDPAAALARVQRLATDEATPLDWAGRHLVQRGDSLWALGQRYGASAERIAAANGIRTEDVLRPRTVLMVPIARGVEARVEL